jgi:predicted nucleic acid-binding protein
LSKTFFDKFTVKGASLSKEICNITPHVIKKSIELLEKDTLRTMDALHIGCALEWEAELFVSSDKRQILAAKKAGLKVVSV